MDRLITENSRPGNGRLFEDLGKKPSIKDRVSTPIDSAEFELVISRQLFCSLHLARINYGSATKMLNNTEHLCFF